ncbi:MAG: hypothetical protein IPM47_00545 [Sphingobacteriales bacterium]|nr:MAG: hypothetical protein IPM47_00545 [Sphingobacteriales bacterium]
MNIFRTSATSCPCLLKRFPNINFTLLLPKRGDAPNYLSQLRSKYTNLSTGFKVPFRDLRVHWDLGVTAGSEVEITLLTLTSQTILQTTLAAGETNKTISVAHLPEGVYLYSVEQSGSVLTRGKVAVVR